MEKVKDEDEEQAKKRKQKQSGGEEMRTEGRKQEWIGWKG